MNEVVLNFGQRQLIGILAVPDEVDPRRPVVLIPNTGIEHRVGPSRLHVRLARAFARKGYVALRLDLSGMGDSPSDPDGDAVRDVQSAMDELQRQGYGGRFAAVGLCSGAHDAHRLALADKRIVAAAFLDGYAYRTPRFFLTYLKQRLADPERLLRFLNRRLAAPNAARVDTEDLDYFRQPERARMRADLAALMARGVALCFVYTGQMQYVYNYAGQLTDAFPELGRYRAFDLYHLAHSDHTFSTPEMSADLKGRLLGWLQRAQPQAATAAATLPAAAALAA
jgi:dienelactone hydrolase